MITQPQKLSIAALFLLLGTGVWFGLSPSADEAALQSFMEHWKNSNFSEMTKLSITNNGFHPTEAQLSSQLNSSYHIGGSPANFRVNSRTYEKEGVSRWEVSVQERAGSEGARDLTLTMVNKKNGNWLVALNGYSTKNVSLLDR